MTLPQELQQWRAEMKAGNNRSLTIIFERYGKQCLRALQREKGCERSDAEDILQDAILLFRINLLDNKLTHTRNLQGYLYTICRNLHRRRVERQHQQADCQEEVARHLYEREYALPTAEHHRGEQEIQRKLELVTTALGMLRPGCQRILRRFYLQYQSIAEITQEMNLANDAVTRSTKSQCYRCWMDQIAQLQHENTVNKSC